MWEGISAWPSPRWQARVRDGDGTERGDESVGPGAAKPEAPALVTVADLEDDLVIGLLHQGAEQAALDLQAGGADVGLDAMRQVRILGGHGEADVEPQVGGEGVIVEIDLLDGGGSLELIGDTHGRISLLALGGELRADCRSWDRSGHHPHQRAKMRDEGRGRPKSLRSPAFALRLLGASQFFPFRGVTPTTRAEGLEPRSLDA